MHLCICFAYWGSCGPLASFWLSAPSLWQCPFPSGVKADSSGVREGVMSVCRVSCLMKLIRMAHSRQFHSEQVEEREHSYVKVRHCFSSAASRTDCTVDLHRKSKHTHTHTVGWRASKGRHDTICARPPPCPLYMQYSKEWCMLDCRL